MCRSEGEREAGRSALCDAPSRAPKPVARRRGAARRSLLPLFALLGSLAGSAAGALPALVATGAGTAPQATGIELTLPVRQTLRRIPELWLQWASAGSRERASALVDELLADVHQLGMSRLPDLSLGALTQAVKAANGGDFRRAHWDLEAAERLDPGRPETAFAATTVDRREGRSLLALAHFAQGYLRLFKLPLERALWLQNLLAWGLWLLLVTGALFVAVQMATKGGALYHDLASALARRLPGAAVVALAVAILIWPLLVPHGPLWLLLYWSLLLWGYGSKSERAVLIALWLILGAAPVLLAAQRRQVEIALSPPARAMSSLAEGRLYGGLFTDLGVLRSLLPESPAVKHLLGDVHRTFEQWDLARSYYRQVLEKEPENTSVLLDLGAYFFYKRDFNTAISLFRRAASADPGSSAALFNLGQAYNESRLFDEALLVMTQAKQLDYERVTQWVNEHQRVVPVQGGLARIPEIRRELAASWYNRENPTLRLDVVRRALSLVLSAALVLLALALHLARRGSGYTEAPLDVRLGSRSRDRWRRVLLPGFAAAEAGQGGKSYLALLLPAALLTLPLAAEIGYRIPWGYDPGSLVPWIVAVLGLLAFVGARLRLELRDRI